MNTRYLLISAAITGALSALLSLVPYVSLVNCLVCGWLWLGGIAAVWFYRQISGEAVTSRNGLILGLVSGLFGAVVATLMSVFTRGGSSSLPAAQIAQIEQQFGSQAVTILRALEDPATTFTIGLVVNLVTYPLFGLIGGLIGAAIWKPRQT